VPSVPGLDCVNVSVREAQPRVRESHLDISYSSFIEESIVHPDLVLTRHLFVNRQAVSAGISFRISFLAG